MAYLEYWGLSYQEYISPDHQRLGHPLLFKTYVIAMIAKAHDTYCLEHK